MLGETEDHSAYTFVDTAQALDRHGPVGPLGRADAVGDNAPLEAFFDLLQKDVLDRRRWVSRDHT